jgi:hypothetical protein
MFTDQFSRDKAYKYKLPENYIGFDANEMRTNREEDRGYPSDPEYDVDRYYNNNNYLINIDMRKKPEDVDYALVPIIEAGDLSDEINLHLRYGWRFVINDRHPEIVSNQHPEIRRILAGAKVAGLQTNGSPYTHNALSALSEFYENFVTQNNNVLMEREKHWGEKEMRLVGEKETARNKFLTTAEGVNERFKNSVFSITATEERF